jgi:hypothetical protein
VREYSLDLIGLERAERRWAYQKRDPTEYQCRFVDCRLYDTFHYSRKITAHSASKIYQFVRSVRYLADFGEHSRDKLCPNSNPN